MANPQNLKPIQSVNEAREKGRAGGIKSGQVRREKKLLSQIYVDMLMKKHKVGKEEIEGEVLLEKVALKVLGRGDSASVSMLKEIREATEGQKLKVDSDVNINYDDENVKAILREHGIAERRLNQLSDG